MKAINHLELKQLYNILTPWVGSQLQLATVAGKQLSLGFWLDKELTVLRVDLNGTCPVAFITQERSRVKAQKVPLALFLNKHFVGHSLKGLKLDQSKGRVLLLELDGPEALQIELILIPNNTNVIAVYGKKQVSLFKPKDLGQGFAPPSDLTVRSNDQIGKEWASSIKPKTKKNLDLEDPKEKLVKKLNSAVKKVEKEILSKSSHVWRKTAQALEKSQNLNVAEVYLECIDTKKSLIWNIQNCYAKAKKNEAKLAKTIDRLEELKKDLQKVQSGKAIKKVSGGVGQKQAPSKAKYRTLNLGDHSLKIGRSSKDNLWLLREAKSWHLWFHLEDYASAHGFVACNKGEKLTQSFIAKACAAYVKDQLQGQAKNLKGERVSVVYTECRYVQPIKGAPGKVKHQNHKRILVEL